MKKFLKSEKGSVLVILCIAMIPILMIVGLAVDSSMAYNQRQKLSQAVEAAARAAGYSSGSDSAITTIAQNVFAAQTSGMTGVTGPTITIDNTANTITVSATVAVSTMFIKVNGATSGTYSASKSQKKSQQDLMELAIVIEVSQYSINSGWVANTANALKTFIATLPDQTLVSIIPTNTSVYFDTTSTDQTKIFNHLSMTTNDESVNPAYFPLSANYAWNSSNFALVTNFFYTGSFSNKTSYYPLPNTTCPLSTMDPCSVFYPSNCPSGKKSCRDNYSYYLYPMVATLPLTRNKTTINSYLTSLAATSSAANGIFTSLISWAWRTLDPAWNDFFLANTSSSDTSRAAGTYPRAYNLRQKSVIVLVEGDSFWDDIQSSPISKYYTKKCGDTPATWTGACVPGYPCFDRMKYVMTAYGALPITSNISNRDDNGTCANYDYKTVDQGLGLNRSTTSFIDTLDTGDAYETLIRGATNPKMNRICSSMKSAGIDIYVVYEIPSSYLSGTACANSSGNVFNVGNSQATILTALTSIYTKIMAKQVGLS